MGTQDWYFVGCKPAANAKCEQCGTDAEIVHTLELGDTLAKLTSRRVCLECAESLVRDMDKGFPSWAEGKSKHGGLGHQGWTSRWHWEDFNGPWKSIDVGVRRG